MIVKTSQVKVLLNVDRGIRSHGILGASYCAALVLDKRWQTTRYQRASLQRPLRYTSFFFVFFCVCVHITIDSFTSTSDQSILFCFQYLSSLVRATTEWLPPLHPHPRRATTPPPPPPPPPSRHTAAPLLSSVSVSHAQALPPWPPLCVS